LTEESEENGEIVLVLLEKAVKSSLDIVIDGTLKDEMLLCLSLLKMEKLGNHVCL
jgi:hypothetical protein